MRFFKLIAMTFLLSAFGVASGQSIPQPPAAEEVNLTKTVHLFPNPATEDVFVEVEHFPAEKVNVTVHSIIGNKLDVETEVVSEHVIRVQVKDLASGYYLLAIKDDDSNFRGTYKFLKR